MLISLLRILCCSQPDIILVVAFCSQKFFSLCEVSNPNAEWAKELNINRHTLKTRIERLNWSIEKALTTPVKHKNRTK